jgi:hypothetical protein
MDKNVILSNYQFTTILLEKKMKSIKSHQIFTIIFTLLTIIVNVLANALPLNGLNTGEISDQFEILFVPAGYVFSIWGLIYLGLIAFAIFQALPSQRDHAVYKQISPYYVLASIANSVWIFLWHYEVFTLTILAMVTLLASLLVIYILLNKETSSSSKPHKYFVEIPFSIYLGWISVATIANASQLLYYLGWNGWGISASIWTLIMLIVATLLGLAMLVRNQDIAYTLVLIWALIGIARKQFDTPLVANTAWITTGILAIAILITFIFELRLVKRQRRT